MLKTVHTQGTLEYKAHCRFFDKYKDFMCALCAPSEKYGIFVQNSDSTKY